MPLRTTLAFLLVAALALPASAGTGPVITLIDGGSGTKQPLRYAFVKGTEHSFRLQMTMAMTMSMGGRAMPPQQMPGMMMTMSAKVLDVDAQGEARCEFKITEADVSDDPNVQKPMLDSMRKSFKSLVGGGGSMAVSNRGMTRSFELIVPGNVDPMARRQLEEMRENFSQYCVPLPEEAVGAGAKWKTTQTIAKQGMTLEQTMHTTFMSRTGNQIQLDIELEQTAPEQDLVNPQAPDAKMHLKSLRSTGKGTTTASLGALLPLKSTVSLSNDTVMVSPQIGEMTTHMDMSVRGEDGSKPSPG